MRAGDPLPIDLTGVSADAIVGDVVNVNYMTPILLAAQALGCHVQRGVEMMEHQIAVTAEFLGLTAGDWSAATVRQILAEADAP
jgi:shikimate dehydrogenase